MMIKEIRVTNTELTTWQELSANYGISVAYCKQKHRGEYLPLVRRSGWGSPAVIMHVKYVQEIALAFRSNQYEFVCVEAYWWGVRFELASPTSAHVCELWRLGELVKFKVYSMVTW